MITALVCIASNQPQSFVIPTQGSHYYAGRHSNGRSAGGYVLTFEDAHAEKLLLPSRNKVMDVVSDVDGANHDSIYAQLRTLDADYTGETQTSKYKHVMESVSGEGLTFINTEDGTHGSFGILAYGVPMFIIGIHDPSTLATHLIFSTLEYDQITESIQQAYPNRYLVYRFRLLHNRALFVHTEALLSRWWKHMKPRNGVSSPLFAFNALERNLFNNYG